MYLNEIKIKKPVSKHNHTMFSETILCMTRSFSGVTISDCTAGSSMFSLCILDDNSRASLGFLDNCRSSSSVRS